MPGLKALTDRIEGPRRSRYQSFYTASFSIGSAVSLFATGMLAGRYGWPLGVRRGRHRAVGRGSGGRCGGCRPPGPQHREQPQALLDFRPVLRNRESMSYVLAYAAHCWELFAFRTWLVAFMTFTALATRAASARPRSPLRQA